MKRNPKLPFLTVISSALILSCSPAGKLTILNINDSGIKQSGTMLFALPQTVLDITVDARETIIVPGPYHQFAEKYLGIKDAPENPVSSWWIADVYISSHLETDPDYVYSVQGKNDAQLIPGMDKLIHDSLILDMSKMARSQVFYPGVAPPLPGNEFTERAVSGNTEDDMDVAFGLLAPFSGAGSKQAGKNVPKSKTLEQSAEETAKLLFKIRKRRFKMISAQYDLMPEGTAMKAALKELDKEEELYLSLFIGQRKVIQRRQIFHFTPAAMKKTDRVLLLRFSETDGFLSKQDARGKPVMLDLSGAGKTKGLEQLELLNRSADNTILYRIPDLLTIQLLWGEDILAEELIPVFQAGAMVKMTLPDKAKK